LSINAETWLSCVNPALRLCATAQPRAIAGHRCQHRTTLGPYEITGTLGAGSMGEVYRGRDRLL